MIYYYRGIDFVWILIFCIPVVYCLSSCASKRKQLIESIRESPLFLLVSTVRLHKDFLGYRRFLKFSEERVQNIIDLERSNDTYYCTIEDSRPFVGSPIDQAYDFLEGQRTYIIEMSPQTAGDIKYWCRTYFEATKRFQIFFVLSITVATIFVLTTNNPSDDTIFLIFILMCILAVVGFFPKAETIDHTDDSSHFSRQHYHIYTFSPPNVKNPEGLYKCVCGKKLNLSTDDSR
jgi:hypothetical protein